MKNLIVIIVVGFLGGCAHWEAAFQDRDYSCNDKAMRINKNSGQYELAFKNDLCFEDSIGSMKHSAEL